MFRNLQCVQKGCVRTPAECDGAAAVYADDYGGVWVVSADAQHLYYYTAQALATSMQPQPATMPAPSSHTAGPSPAQGPPPPYTLAFSCAAGAADEVQALLFFNGDAGCGAATPRRDACVVTRGGSVAFLRVPAGSEERPAWLQPYQEVRLDLHVTATTATANAVILCCYDGAYTEVVRTVVVPAAADGRTCAHQSDSAMADAECSCDVEAVGLFRVQGRVQSILHDAVHDALVSVSTAGNVDVWDIAAAADVTAQYGSPAWDVATHGAATCAMVCRSRLWIGLSSGHLLVCPLVSSRSPATVADGEGGRTAAASSAAVSMTLLRSHNSAISGLTSMSMQSSIWSCAEDNGRVNVWDAATAAFRGSFVFPNSGIRSCHAGVAQLRTALWGVSAASAEPCLLQVTESISRRDAYPCCSDDARSSESSVALAQAYRQSFGDLLRHYSNLSQHSSDGLEMAAAEVDATALDRVAEDVSDVPGAAAAVYDLRDTLECLRRVCAARQRMHSGDEAAPPSVVLDALLHDWQHTVGLQHEVASFLDAVQDLCGEETSVKTLEDAQEVLRGLHTRGKELEEAVEEARQADFTEAVAEATAEATEALQADLAALRDSLQSAEDRCQRLEAQLHEAQADMAALREQHRGVDEALEEREAQLEEARRSLLATKRAAEVTATEVSSMFEMESKLHASQQVIDELSAKVETLLQDAEEQQDSLHAYERKESAAREVVRLVLSTQRAIADSVSDFIDAVDSLGTPSEESGDGDAVASLRTWVNTLQNKAFALEVSVETQMKEQKEWLHSLSGELRATLIGK